MKKFNHHQEFKRSGTLYNELHASMPEFNRVGYMIVIQLSTLLIISIRITEKQFNFSSNKANTYYSCELTV